MSKGLAVAVTCMLALSSVFASEERAIEVVQPIATEDAIYLSRVTFVTYSDQSWAGLVDYTCQESFVVNDSKKAVSRNAASIAGIKNAMKADTSNRAGQRVRLQMSP